MRRSTTALILIAIVIVGAALALRANDRDPVAADTTTTASTGPDTTTTQTPSETTTTTRAATTSTPPATLPEGSVVCDFYEGVVTTGAIETDDLVEASGMAASRTDPGVLWSHNDSRGGPILHAFTLEGTDLGAYAVDGAFALDWEDMAAGPDANGEGRYLYVGDTGDNFGIRDGDVAIWRVPDLPPTEMDGTFPDALGFSLRMPDGPYDSEAMFIDPVEPALYLVTKSRSEAFVFKGPMTQAPEPQRMDLVATLFLDAEVSGADISSDGSIIAFRGYRDVWMWSRAPGQSVADALSGEPCDAPSPDERQGESIALLPDLSYVTVSEGSNAAINYVEFSR